MECALFWRRQSLCSTEAICSLPEQASVALAVGLKNDPLSVARPERTDIFAAKCKPPHRPCPRKVIDCDEHFFSVIDFDRSLFTIGRNTRNRVLSRHYR